MELTLEELQILVGLLEAKIFKEYLAVMTTPPSQQNDIRQDRQEKIVVLHGKILTAARKML